MKSGLALAFYLSNMKTARAFLAIAAVFSLIAAPAWAALPEGDLQLSPKSVDLPKMVEGSEGLVAVDVTVDKSNEPAFRDLLQGGRVWLNGKVFGVLDSLIEALDQPTSAVCRISETSILLVDGKVPSSVVTMVRVELDKMIPTIDVRTEYFTLSCTKLERGSAFSWQDLIASTKGFLSFRPL